MKQNRFKEDVLDPFRADEHIIMLRHKDEKEWHRSWFRHPKAVPYLAIRDYYWKLGTKDNDSDYSEFVQDHNGKIYG